MNPRLNFTFKSDDTVQPTLPMLSSDGFVPRFPESVDTDRYQQWIGFSVLSKSSFDQI